MTGFLSVGHPEFDASAKLIIDYLAASKDRDEARKVVHHLLGYKPLAMLPGWLHVEFRRRLKEQLDAVTDPTQPCEVPAVPMTAADTLYRLEEARRMHRQFKTNLAYPWNGFGSQQPEPPSDPWSRTFHR